MRQLVHWSLAFCCCALWAVGRNAQTSTSSATIPLPPTLEQNLSAVVVLYNVGQDDKAKPIGYGFFVNPWTIVSSNRLLQDAGRDGSLRLTIYSVNRKQNYRPLFADIMDKDRDLLKVEVRERGPQGLALANTDKLKPGDKVYLLRAKSDDNRTGILVEAKAPLSKEHCGEPLFNEAGQLLGMGIDPALKAFAEYGMLPAKALLKLSAFYAAPYKNGKLTCPAGFFCKLDQPGESKWDVRPLKHARPFTGAFDDDSFLPPPPDVNPKMLPNDPVRILEGRAIRKIGPHYPDTAKAIRVSGAVQVRIVYDEQGEVILARPVSGHPLLQRPSLEAARQWLFEPTVFEGKKIKVEGFLTFNFTLN